MSSESQQAAVQTGVAAETETETETQAKEGPTGATGAAGATGGTPPTTRPPTRAQEMLLDFLQEHDAACPLCGYNVRALTRPVCPECRQELTLTVGMARLRMGWLFASLAPGFFSGIAACFVLVPITGSFLFGNQSPPILIIAVDLFGWCSGVFAIILARNRSRFLALPLARQRWFALTMWGVHVFALVLFVLLAAAFL